MAVTQRARRDQDKAERRRAILDVATGMLGPSGFHGITMAEVARRSGLAKGTLYLYFRSKEELFLAALDTELSDWFSALDRLIDGPTPIDALASGIARSLAARPKLMELMALLHNVLEQNVEVQTAIAFKRALLTHLHAAATAIEAAVPDLPRGAGAVLLVRLNALAIGLRQMADPAPNVATALREADLAPLRIDFERDFAAALGDMLRGMTRRLKPC